MDNGHRRRKGEGGRKAHDVVKYCVHDLFGRYGTRDLGRERQRRCLLFPGGGHRGERVASPNRAKS